MTRGWSELVIRESLRLRGGERALAWFGVSMMTLGSSAAPWFRVGWPTLGAIGLAAVGVLCFASAITVWTVRDERGWAKALGAVPMVVGTVAAGGYAFGVFVLSLLVRAIA